MTKAYKHTPTHLPILPIYTAIPLTPALPILTIYTANLISRFSRSTRLILIPQKPLTRHQQPTPPCRDVVFGRGDRENREKVKSSREPLAIQTYMIQS